jgi:hypothetical protein
MCELSVNKNIGITRSQKINKQVKVKWLCPLCVWVREIGVVLKSVTKQSEAWAEPGAPSQTPHACSVMLTAVSSHMIYVKFIYMVYNTYVIELC